MEQGVPLVMVSRRKVVSTDASNKGWGALCSLWSKGEGSLNINCLEMLAVCRALYAYLPDLKGHHVLVRSNSIIVVAYINHQGGLSFWRALARFGGHCHHKLVQHRYRAIGSFLQHCTYQWQCNNTALLKKASVIGEKVVFPICVLNKRCSTCSRISGNRGYDSNRVRLFLLL